MDVPRQQETQVLLRQQVLEWLLDKLQYAVRGSTPSIDLDYLHYICTHYLMLISALEGQLHIPENIISAVRELCSMVRDELSTDMPSYVQYESAAGTMGRPKLDIDEERLTSLLEIHLPIPCIATLLGVSNRTVYRRMAEFGLSVSASFNTMTDQELDTLVSSIKAEMPHIGYRIVMGRLRSMCHRIQWTRLRASMHRVDAVGIFSRLTRLGCVVRRSYSVRAPLSLVHVDTNHKLIRYNIVVFGGIDGFSIKIMYLDAANNNKAVTAFALFMKSVERNGLPSRIERLWRDVWWGVTSTYYDVLHGLEEDGLLDITNILHIFLVHFVFLPPLRRDLQTFMEGWNNHPLRTEGNVTPQQLWHVGLLQNSFDETEDAGDLQYPDIDWESAVGWNDGLDCEASEEAGIVIPQLPIPLSEQEMAEL